MSDGKRLDVIKLDEKKLWKLHEKLKKLQAKENETTTHSDNIKKPIERKSKPVKYQVYQPGVTRLSNRKLAASFDRSTVENSSPVVKETPKSKNESLTNSTPRGNDSINHRKDSKLTPKPNSNKNVRGRRTNYRNRVSRNQKLKEEPEVEAEEGFLTRHKRRQKQGDCVDDFSSEEEAELEHDDELAWDNYGGSGLVHHGWSPQVTNTETSSQEGGDLSDSELYKELSFDENVCKTEEKLPEVDEVPDSREEGTASVATNESNKEYYKVTHSVSSQSEQDDDNEGEYDDNDEFDQDESSVSKGDNVQSKRQLYDPNNPDQPIVMGKEKSRRDGGKYFIPNSGDNVYSPTLSKERMMSKVTPTRPQRKKSPVKNYTRRNSPPRYFGNRYQEDNHWQEYESHSPVGSRNYHYSTENLSEDEDSLVAQSRNTHHQSRLTALHDAERHESMLSNILSSPSFDSHEYNESLTRARNKLKILYEGMITNDIEAATNNNIEQKLWRNVYYQVIEILREQIRSCPEQDSSELKINLILLLDQGTAFYESLLENLQHKNRFNLKEILNSASARKRHRTKAGKRSKLAILSCQRIFICLGDIARYREQADHTSNYGRARHCYLQSQVLAPKNGRPYNQLAILAVKTRHKLDAVYYYIRSLAASNPILSARESLMVLFDEIRRKIDFIKQRDDTEAKKRSTSSKGKESSKVAKSRTNINEGSSRRWEEVWILPGSEDVSTKGVKAEKQSSAETDLPELRLSSQEMTKHFTLLFLNLHGKLFTRIGLENFGENLTKTLRIFEATKLMSNHRLLQLFAINLFAVLNAEKLSIHARAHDSSQNQHRALKFVFSMFTIIVDQVNKTFKAGSGNEEFDPFASDDLANLLPSIKVMFDWMYANKSCWYPPPLDLSDKDLNVWDSLAELCNWICNHSCIRPSIQIYSEYNEGLHEVFLPEDSELAGFSPLGQAFSDPRFVESGILTPENKSYIQQSVRISLIRDFLEYLCGMEEPLLAFKQGNYVTVPQTRLRSWSDKSAHDESFTSDYDIDDYTTTADNNDNLYHDSATNQQANNDGEELSELRKYRDSLQMTKERHERRQSQIKSSLESDEKLTLQICPKYLVPDTNCFIDYLKLIEKLVSCGKYKVATPLVVISELEGLATERKGDNDHAEHVFQSAKMAVKFINTMFSDNNSKFCALTRRGTELKSSRFRSEESSNNHGNNDDFILESTQAYSQSIQEHDKSIKTLTDGIVHTSVVLLTNDRNLRLKCLLLRDVATKNIQDFCAWAKV
ncbi:telomerase-binding protein EST1A-like [Styela clava]